MISELNCKKCLAFIFNARERFISQLKILSAQRLSIINTLILKGQIVLSQLS